MMGKSGWIAVMLLLFVLTGMVLSGDDDDSEGLLRPWFEGLVGGSDVADSRLYVEECGGCHFPYQPGLLPASSWDRILAGLEDHFGENAELESSDLKVIRNYLLKHAAGQVNHGLPNKIMAAQGDRPIPLRITQMRYFVLQHRELPRRMVQDNPKVKSFSNCERCHQSARQGLYGERTVRIPGFAQWDS